jgi:1-acyl-sn-glycerol-3-phosphate acyltransferase
MAPVVPAFIKGTAEALPRGAKFPRFNRVFIYIGKPLRFDRDLEYSAIAERVMQGILALRH